MKRIDTDTREVDKHGTGRDGFRYGDPAVPTAPTEVDDTWLDNVQEELARVVERGGIDAALDENDFEQVHRTIAQNDGLTDGYVSGFEVTEVSAPSLNGALSPGVFYLGGRRYYVTQADIDAAGTDSPRTYGTNLVTYITVAPDDTDGTSYTFTAYTTAVGSITLPSFSINEVVVARVITDGTNITATSTWDALETTFPRNRVGYGTQQSIRIVPQSTTSGISDSEGNSLGADTNQRYWRRVYAQEHYMRDLSSLAAGGGRVRQYMRRATVSSGGSTSIALNYSDLGNSQAIGALVHVVALRTDVTTGQSKMWLVGRLMSTDNVGTFSFQGAETRQEVTASGNADVSWSIASPTADPFIVCTVGGAGETWDFFLHIQTIITDA